MGKAWKRVIHKRRMEAVRTTSVEPETKIEQTPEPEPQKVEKTEEPEGLTIFEKKLEELVEAKEAEKKAKKAKPKRSYKAKKKTTTAKKKVKK